MHTPAASGYFRRRLTHFWNRDGRAILWMALAWALGLWFFQIVAEKAAVRQAVGSFHAGAPIPLQRLAGGQGIGGKLGFLVDRTGELQIEQIVAADPQDPRFRFRYPGDKQRLGVGLGQGVVWAKFQFSVAERVRDARWLMVMPSVAARDIQFHGPYDAGGTRTAAPQVAGADHPFSSRPAPTERMSFPFRVLEPGLYTVYFRVRSDVMQVYAPRLWNETDYLVSTDGKRLFDGLTYGILLGMLVYNLLLLSIFRERMHAYYLVTCACAVLTLASFNGHLARYLWPDAPALPQYLYTTAPLLWTLFASQFGRHFLNLRAHAPRIDQVLASLALVLACMWGAVTASGDLSLQVRWLSRATEVVAVLGPPLLAVGGVRAYRAGFKPAMLYLGGLAILVLSALLLILSNWGVLPWSGLQLNLLQLGAAAELVVLSVALGSRIRSLRRAQQELHARADSLVTQAETDPLTGVANRRGLQRRADRQFATGAPQALLLLDLDRFKPINDRFGHHAGDRVLVELARRLRSELRDIDTVARLGGDEFVVLVSGETDRGALSAMAHRMGEQLRAPVDYEGRALMVTASIGIARFPKDARDLAGLLRAADAAMYHSKQQRHSDFAFPEDMQPAAQAAG
ncbi:diguanylate cyclase [Xylophilus sp. Leaf220]|uniref:diguanylate cyclase n=1 Tax=Xylophilus sp. Leaf220 TaxID=1735686 RepID=UPI0009E88701|nr:diguanylate cyclase [Xylophilus sp. Leaf220]